MRTWRSLFCWFPAAVLALAAEAMLYFLKVSRNSEFYYECALYLLGIGFVYLIGVVLVRVTMALSRVGHSEKQRPGFAVILAAPKEAGPSNETQEGDRASTRQSQASDSGRGGPAQP